MTKKKRLSGPTCLFAAAATAMSLVATAPAQAEVCQSVAALTFNLVGSFASVRITNLSTTQALTVQTVTVGPLPTGLTATAHTLSNITAAAGRSYAFAFANVPQPNTTVTAATFLAVYDAPAQSTGEVGIQNCVMQ